MDNFWVGFLSAIVMLLGIGIVLGTIFVVRLGKQVKELFVHIDSGYQNTEEIKNSIMEEIQRDRVQNNAVHEEIFREIDSRIDKLRNELKNELKNDRDHSNKAISNVYDSMIKEIEVIKK